MPGDGVSLPTTLAQLGTVAKTQAKGQQQAPQVIPFAEKEKEQEELKVERVKEATEAEKNRIAGEGDKPDRRKRRRLRRQRRKRLPAGDDHHPDAEAATDGDDGTEEPLGSLIDLRV